jgi:hypothetical protein
MTVIPGLGRLRQDYKVKANGKGRKGRVREGEEGEERKSKRNKLEYKKNFKFKCWLLLCVKIKIRNKI